MHPHSAMPLSDTAAVCVLYNRCALISRDAGGIGLSVSHIRATQSYIRSSGGRSSGLVPMLRVFDATARYVDQGGGKRKGAFAIYLEPWHADVEAFLEMKKNHGTRQSAISLSTLQCPILSLTPLLLCTVFVLH